MCNEFITSVSAGLELCIYGKFPVLLGGMGAAFRHFPARFGLGPPHLQPLNQRCFPVPSDAARSARTAAADAELLPAAAAVDGPAGSHAAEEHSSSSSSAEAAAPGTGAARGPVQCGTAGTAAGAGGETLEKGMGHWHLGYKCSLPAPVCLGTAQLAF